MVWMTQMALRVAKWSPTVNPISICGAQSRRAACQAWREFSLFPHSILCPIYAAEMFVITKYLLQRCLSLLNISCNLSHQRRILPADSVVRPKHPRIGNRNLIWPPLRSLRVCSPFSFHLLFISFHFPPSLLPDDLAPLDRRTNGPTGG